MAGYFTVDNAFWSDPDIADNFTPEDKYFYLYLLTCPNANISGCYELSMKQAAYDTGYSKETVERLVDRFTTLHKVVDYCAETKEIIVCNWGKYHWTTSEKYTKALLKRIDNVKTDKFKRYLLFSVNKFMESTSENRVWIRYQDFEYRMDTSFTFSYTLPSPGTSSEKEIGVQGEEGKQKQQADDKPKKRDRHSIPPTVEEVAEYCKARNNGIDAELFCDFYASKGWKVGKDTMKDWQASVRTWEKKEEDGKGNGARKNKRSGYGGSYQQNTEHNTDFSRIRPSLDPDDYPDSCRVGA